MAETSEELSFGQEEDHGERRWIYARYAAGDHIGTIASDANKSVTQIYEIMKSCPDDYEKTKVRREQFTGLRLNRSQSLLDAWNLRQLEKLDKDGHDLTLDQIKELVKLNKNLAHRIQLHEGKATAIINDISANKTMSIEELEIKLIKLVKFPERIEDIQLELCRRENNITSQ